MNWMILVPVMVAAADQAIKSLIRLLPAGKPFFRIPGFFELVPCANTGAAFSILRGNNALLIAISAALLFFCLYMKRSMRLTKAASLACMLLIGGGAGNLIDRLRFGGVTDYIRPLFVQFPVFNLADIAITCSVLGLIVLLMMNRLEESAGDAHE